MKRQKRTQAGLFDPVLPTLSTLTPMQRAQLIQLLAVCLAETLQSSSREQEGGNGHEQQD